MAPNEGLTCSYCEWCAIRDNVVRLGSQWLTGHHVVLVRSKPVRTWLDICSTQVVCYITGVTITSIWLDYVEFTSSDVRTMLHGPCT